LVTRRISSGLFLIRMIYNACFSVMNGKAQGAQFETVIIPLTNSHYIMLKRNLIYTAVTKAVKKVIIVGQKKAIL